MKQIFTLIFVLFSLSLLQAQGLSISPKSEFVPLDGTNEVIAHIKVTNSSGVDMGVTWVRTEENMPTTPEQWQSQICDNLHCFSKTKSTYTFTAPADSTIDFSVHLTPPGELGNQPNPIVHIKMFPTDDESKAVNGTYVFGNPVAIPSIKEEHIRILPNPASTYFRVENGTQVEHIEMFNILGVKVLETNGMNNHYVDISSLKHGLYFVRFVGRDSKILTTQRLQKN